MKRIVHIIWLLLLVYVQVSQAQSTLHFNKITVEQGLNDGAVQAICHDKMGFMWISTIGGLNRYNGSRITFYDRVESDTGAVPITLCRNITLDSAGRLFFAFENGLGMFDYNRNRIIMLPAAGNKWIRDMFATSDTSLYLILFEGLYCYNAVSGQLTFLPDFNWYGEAHGRIRSWAYQNGKMYLLSKAGLHIADPERHRMEKMQLPEPLTHDALSHITLDGSGNLWLGMAGKNMVSRLPENRDSIKTWSLDHLTADWGLSQLVSAPNHPYVWLATGFNGLLQYVPALDRFIGHEHNPLQAWTSNTNLVRGVHIDNRGIIWFGGDYGINYANPARLLFSIIPPFDTDITNRNRRTARVATEDLNGHLWFGTYDGVVQYQPGSGQYREFNNRIGEQNFIHFNSVRGVVATAGNKLWIATGRGINRYDIASRQMQFFDEKDGISKGFYFSVNEDRAGNIWFSCRDGDGLYYYKTAEQKFYSIAQHPQLAQFKTNGFRYLFQDSKNRYWMGFNGQGLGMYNPATGQTETWNSVPGKNPPIAGNYVVDIKEDLNGRIWVSTFNGLSGIDPQTYAVSNYTTGNGLLSNSVSALAVDSLNRLWIGTARGLMMFDENRRYFTSFGLADGLPSISFPEHAGYQASNGDIIMGTLNGYIRFNPLRFNPVKTAVPCYIADIEVLNRDKANGADFTAPLHLAYYQNAINLQLVGVNYDNPAQTWYAYQLEGFEKDWHYSQDPKVVYTNLPGGDYRFLFKAGTNAYDWQMPANVLHIAVGTVFYKSAWFWVLIAILVAGILYVIYRQRMAQQEQVFALQSKTQSLEKEKALVMYENLKQHLNPHFLFNSLTSLSSLIRLDQDMAGDFLDRMSKIYRYILKNRESETVTLSEELSFVNNFIELQKTRFENALVINVLVEEEHLYKKIAPVTLQNLVENAIKHNTLSKSKPLGIDFFAEQDYLVVRNNLQRKNFVETSNKTGLHSMQDLYRYLSTRPLIVEEDGKYFWVKIPLL